MQSSEVLGGLSFCEPNGQSTQLRFTSLVATVDGKLHHFSNVGLYDGIFVMQDAETKTLWNHITGEAMYGPLAGRSLGPVGNLLQMNVKQALAMDAKIQIAISDRVYFAATHRYYPIERIRERGRAFVDRLDARDVLIYIDPETNTPAALFVTASMAPMQDKEIHLETGAVVRDGVLFNRSGKRQTAGRPQQVFTRWYGFALTFPGSEVFGQ